MAQQSASLAAGGRQQLDNCAAEIVARKPG
jgi:hypothetical protein